MNKTRFPYNFWCINKAIFLPKAHTNINEVHTNANECVFYLVYKYYKWQGNIILMLQIWFIRHYWSAFIKIIVMLLEKSNRIILITKRNISTSYIVIFCFNY